MEHEDLLAVPAKQFVPHQLSAVCCFCMFLLGIENGVLQLLSQSVPRGFLIFYDIL